MKAVQKRLLTDKVRVHQLDYEKVFQHYTVERPEKLLSSVIVFQTPRDKVQTGAKLPLALPPMAKLVNKARY